MTISSIRIRRLAAMPDSIFLLPVAENLAVDSELTSLPFLLLEEYTERFYEYFEDESDFLQAGFCASLARRTRLYPATVNSAHIWLRSTPRYLNL